MLSTITLVILSTAIFTFYHYIFRRKYNDRFPPGPWGLPFVGNLLSLEPQLHRPFGRWAKKYGPILGIKLGEYRAVVLSDIKVIREAFNQTAFSGRPSIKLLNSYANGKHGLLNAEGREWTEQRQFALRKLRDFGVGRRSMECSIMDEVSDVLEWLKLNRGKPVLLHRKFSFSVANALMTILSGKHYDPRDPFLKNLLDKSIEIFMEATESGWLWFMPTLAKWFPAKLKKVERSVAPFIQLFQNIVNEHLEAPSPEDSSDFCYAYLDEVNNTSDPTSSFYKERGHMTLRTVFIDLYGAGAETTTTSMEWTILYLMTHPDVQEKLQSELDRVTEKKRAPSLADRSNTSYAEAVIQEVLRFSSHAATGLMHSTVEDVEFHGYCIPKDTLVIANYDAVHHDVKTWGDPENFRPERFLSHDGKLLRRNDAFIPFSVGKRVCVGEALARDQLYLFMTNIFYKFKVIPDPASPNPSFKPDGSFILKPKPYNAIFTERVVEL